MLQGLGLPRIQIATKLYGAIALTLAVVYALAAGTTWFAGEAERAAAWVHAEALQRGALINELETVLERQRQLVASLPSYHDQEARAADARLYEVLGARIGGLVERIDLPRSHKLPRLAARVEEEGAQAYVHALSREEEQAAAAAGRYAASAGDLQLGLMAERQARARSAERVLATLAEQSRSIITWVCAAAAASGLLIGPIGLLLLRRVLVRLQGIGWALLRLARNDNSVDIPGLADQDEVGQLARSVAVFKAKSIELLQKKAELERLNLQLDAAINNMPLGLSMFDAQERLMVCNKKYADMYGLPGELSRPGTAYCALWDFRERQGAKHHTGPAAGTPEPDQANSLTIEFGNDRIISVSRQPLKGGGWVDLHEDITQRRRQEQEITHLARHDPLTSLGNRALFRERLNLALKRLQRGQGFAVMCLDLDRFKIVNDTLGHPVGDVLLRQVSERLLACVRQGDVVARFGGDEFAIIQSGVSDPDQTESLAARIVETISKAYEIDGQRIDISTSIGMTLAPRDGSDPDQLMKNADLALYRAKADGRNGFSFFKTEMNERIQVRRTLELDLRKAFEKEQLQLHYQPLVCLRTRRVLGFEALMRWTHPERGPVGPGEFIALAEEIGLIGPMGEWALRKACMEAAHWSQPAKVAINLSPLQIKRDLIEVVLQALAESGLPPGRLELEITESLLLQDTQNTFATLHQLRQLGVGIAMDDFGRGYCSLSYLRSFPFDKIKIDRMFIAGIDRGDEGARAIVEGIIGLGRKLGMATVAEGIESFEQLQSVRAFGCEQAQGYYFSPAVPAGEVERVLRDTFEHARSAA